MALRDLYPFATEPTEPRFKVGEMVHLSGGIYVTVVDELRRGYFALDDTAGVEAAVSQAESQGKSVDVVVYPALFGVVIEYQEPGTKIYTNEPQGLLTTWRGWEHDYEEAELDLPESGSIWFLPDNERRYFVRWANKEPYRYGEPHSEFTPMKSVSGETVQNISLISEECLRKCPDFVNKLRGQVMKRKRETAEEVLEERLGLDEYTTRGILDEVCKYSAMNV